MTNANPHQLDVHIRKDFADFSLEVSFAAGKGVTALFGPSGAGKTTLVNCIAGLEEPDDGSIRIKDKVLYDVDEQLNVPSHKRRIGYVFQDARLFPHMTVKQNLSFGLAYTSLDQRWAKWGDVVSLLGLEDLLDRSPHHLSGGERQRVAIGRALIASPELLLMDEPLSNLDPMRRLEILPFLEQIRDDLDIPVIYVSHNVDEIVRLADHVVILENGKVSTNGPIDKVLNRLDVQSNFDPKSFGEGGADLGTLLEAMVVKHDEDHGLTHLSASGDGLYVPRLMVREDTPIRLRLLARDVALALEEPTNTSVLNCLQCHIVKLSDSSTSHVDVELRTKNDQTLWARITKKSATTLNLKEDLTVWAMIKSVAIESGVPRILKL